MIRKSAYLPPVYDKHTYIAVMDVNCYVQGMSFPGPQSHMFHEFHLTILHNLSIKNSFLSAHTSRRLCLLFFPATVLSPYNTQICSNTDPKQKF